jgi:hypothetical protein
MSSVAQTGQSCVSHCRIRSTTLSWLLAAWLCAAVAAPAGQSTDPASALLASYAAMGDRLEHSPFPHHVYIESIEGESASRGDVYSIVDYPMTTVTDAFNSPSHWCDALILHLNVKYCHPITRDGHTLLSVAIGRKHDQPLSSAARVEFEYRVAAARPDFLDVELNALHGPLGTSNYRIGLEGVALEKGRAFVHLRYSYDYGAETRMAMQLYLATAGSDKVGFTVVGDPHASPQEFIGGVRGAIERNSMRYYLAIDAYLGTRAAPAPDRFEQSIERWFDATERYPRQLHEIDRTAYLAMKRSEYQRQQTIQ